MKIIAIIPARYGSTRLPAKPLLLLQGKSIVQRTYEQVKQVPAIDRVVVATDDTRIFDHVEGFGGEVVMTNPNHPSGTDRCAEALEQLNVASETDFVLNVQGDEPFIQPQLITDLLSAITPETQIATAVKRITDFEQLTNPNVVKAVISSQQRALYFSRQTIPYGRDISLENWLNYTTYYKHIGIYGFRPMVLAQLVKLPISALEAAEKLEQLRWLENGYTIQVAITEWESQGIDTPADFEKFK